MTPERWQRVRDLHGRASELPAAERAAFLTRECGEDVELRREIEDLLAAHRDDSFLDQPAINSIGADSPRLGMSLGDFDLLSVLGQGAMGIVYLAHQRSLRREVALKVLPPGLFLTPAQIDRFHREARAVASLRHEHVVRVHCEGRTGDTHWFAMEFVRGHDLNQELERQRGVDPRPSRLPGRSATGHYRAIAMLAAQIAEALEHAHSHGIVHRDVKPHNILLDAATGSALLTDFGLARDEAQGSMTAPGIIAGTPHYMSPEQARIGSTLIDHRTDVFSLGVVLYELLTWRRPYDGDSAEEIRSSLLTTEARSVRRLFPSVPRDLEIICHTAMAKSPRDRYSTAGAMATDLRLFLAHEAIQARPPGWLDLARRAARRNRRRLITAGVLVAGLATGAMVTNAAIAASRNGCVTVLAVDFPGEVHSIVECVPLDPVTGQTGPVLLLGEGPVRQAAVPMGLCRIRVQVPGEPLREFTRTVSMDEVTVQFGPVPSGTPNVLRIDAGTLKIPTNEAPTLAIAGVAVEVAAFLLDEHEVSNADYRRFLDATGHEAPRHWPRTTPAHDALPVVNVSFADAVAYAEWAGKRLPTFAEWMLAARGEELWPYPWTADRTTAPRGNTMRPKGLFDSAQAFEEWYFANAAPVTGADDARTPSGLRHMFGNAAEWTESPVAERDGGKVVLHDNQRFLLGGACDIATRGATLAAFEFQGTGSGFANPRYGFRCARSLR